MGRPRPLGQNALVHSRKIINYFGGSSKTCAKRRALSGPNFIARSIIKRLSAKY